MKEQIGNVVINYEKYGGVDLYCDGPIEDKLLEIARTHEEDELNQVIAESHSWEIMYHFSHIRQNIVSWLPITKEDHVLEIGSGCGAITGALAEKAGKVTCIELSKKRTLINANRNKKYDNVEILVGNFMDIEPELPEQYDYITLIGVFEYAASYIPGENPYENFLNTIKKHLKQNGKIVMAIENQFGLKYWAGCQEDHVGKYFESIEGYGETSNVKTFSKGKLEKIFDTCGFANRLFYYPYPDYKFPLSIYSDEFLPKVGELNNNMNNFDRERVALFDESLVFNEIIANGMFPFYSNSYLVILEQGEH